MYHANGDLVCESRQVPIITPTQYAQFSTFSSPNANYQPNAYRSQHGWYADQNKPCCSVPCRDGCRGVSSSALSPPHDYGKVAGEERE